MMLPPLPFSERKPARTWSGLFICQEDLSGFAKVLVENYADKLDDEGKNYLSRIQAGSVKATRLIDDLLRLSRISHQDMKRTEMVQKVNCGTSSAGSIRRWYFGQKHFAFTDETKKAGPNCATFPFNTLSLLEAFGSDSRLIKNP